MASRILFPDLNDYEPSVDFLRLTRWLRAHYGIAMIGIKASEGTDWTSSRFHARWERLGHLAEIRLAYHFAHIGEDSPKAEADHFWSVVHSAGIRRQRGRADLLCLDAERGHSAPRDSRKWMGDFLARLDSHSKPLRPAWIYGGEWLRQHLSPGPIPDRYIWLSAYVDDPTPFWPRQFSVRNRIAWQFTGDGQGPGPHTLPGCPTNIDINEFRGSKTRLLSVAGAS